MDGGPRLGPAGDGPVRVQQAFRPWTRGCQLLVQSLQDLVQPRSVRLWVGRVRAGTPSSLRSEAGALAGGSGCYWACPPLPRPKAAPGQAGPQPGQWESRLLGYQWGLRRANTGRGWGPMRPQLPGRVGWAVPGSRGRAGGRREVWDGPPGSWLWVQLSFQSQAGRLTPVTARTVPPRQLGDGSSLRTLGWCRAPTLAPKAN